MAHHPVVNPNLPAPAVRRVSSGPSGGKQGKAGAWVGACYVVSWLRTAPLKVAPVTYGGRLDALNFLLADVRGGLGPYVGVFLLTQAHWDPATIGAVLTVSGLIGITLHAPVGALIDATRHKRGLVVAGIAALAVSALAIAHVPTLPVVLAADIAMAVLGAVFAPTVAAITVGLVRRHELAARLGRNAAFDRTGNIFIAGVAGLVGWAVSQQAVFYLTPLFGVLTATVMLSIPAVAIDHERARGLDETRDPAP